MVPGANSCSSCQPPHLEEAALFPSPHVLDQRRLQADPPAMRWPWKGHTRAPAVADLEALETWLSPLLQKLDGRGRVQLACKAAQQLRRSQQQRKCNQVNPNGSPFGARKPRDLRGKKDRIKRRMFEKLKMARYLKAKGSPQQAVIGFVSRVSRIARVHQYGLKDRAERGAPRSATPDANCSACLIKICTLCEIYS